MPSEYWILPIRTLTPAFVGGADPNDVAVANVSAAKGALRAWYRMIVGPAVAAGLVPKFAHLSEARIFGGTAPGEGRGVVSLSLMDVAPTGVEPWSNRELRRSDPGLAYLGFSFDMGENRRKALSPGTRFKLRILLIGGLDPLVRELLGATLWAWVSLGGLGSRSRRGFGSLAVDAPCSGATVQGVPVKLPKTLSWLRAAPPDFASFGQQLDQGAFALRRAVEAVGIGPFELLARRDPAGADPLDPSYVLLPTDHDGWRKSRLLVAAGPDRRGYDSARAALNHLGVTFAELRRTKAIDGLPSGALSMLQRGEALPHAPRRAAFGLPLALRPVGQGGGSGFELMPYVRRRSRPGEAPQPEVAGRAPSPLLFSIAPMGDRFVVLLTLLSGPWPGRDLALRERKQKTGEVPADPSNRLPEQLFGKFPRIAEVEL